MTSYDVVIVGAGANGALTALRLAQAGASVLLMDAGPRLERWRIVEQFRNSAFKGDFMSPYPPAPYALHPQYSPDNGYLQQKGANPYVVGYIRAVGGTTWHWTGQAWRMMPNDFRVRSLYGVGRDWPVDYATLEPWYYQAELEMGVSGPDDEDLGSPRAQPYPMQKQPLSYYDQRIKARLAPGGYHLVTEPQARNTRPYDGRPTCCGNNNCSPICPIDAQFTGDHAVRKAERAGAKVLAEAVVYRVEADAKGRIAAVHYKDPNGLSHRVTGKVFVLSANAIETPKLLLQSADDRHPNGIANSSGQVGRNLTDQPGTKMTFLADEELWAGRGPMRLSCLQDTRDGDFRRDYAAFKINFSNASPFRAITESLINQGLTGPALDAAIRHRAARQVTVASLIEQMPDPNNRVLPSATEKDALGIPKPELHYAIDSYVDRAAAQSRKIYQRISDLMGGTELKVDDRYMGNNHVTGTLMMGADPRDSVVDADCRSHDHPNLFMASTGVMCTGSTVNPTLTSVALALRATETIKSEL
jgi:choline dehydrogenase-like flavoprotein